MLKVLAALVMPSALEVQMAGVLKTRLSLVVQVVLSMLEHQDLTPDRRQELLNARVVYVVSVVVSH